MEKFCWKEDYTVASFYYMKQLEEIVIYGLNQVTLPIINSQLKEQVNNQWQLTQLGKQIFDYSKHQNSELINNKFLKGAEITLRDIKWGEKLNLFKYYFNSKSPDYTVDDILYYKRNQYGHGNPIVNTDKETKFNEKFLTCFHFMTLTQNNLKKYSSALNLPQNR